jgi:hypothetical protein
MKTIITLLLILKFILLWRLIGKHPESIILKETEGYEPVEVSGYSLGDFFPKGLPRRLTIFIKEPEADE